MKTAFVFGKFLPFHLGHLAMMEYALTKCDVLKVLVCGSDREPITAMTRVNWVKASFPEGGRVEVIPVTYLESELPNTSVSSRDVSRAWAERFKLLVPNASILVTSEPYGDYVAEYMGIVHLSFDFERKIIPISATDIRMDILKNWDYLPLGVKRHFSKKIVILGTESTGKTTLAQQLAAHFKTGFVAETAREIIKHSNHFNINDLYQTAYEHARRIVSAQLEPPAALFIDTDVHITQSYSKQYFQQYLALEDWVYAANRADLYLYLNNDVAHVQDGTRLNEQGRDMMELSHRNTLDYYGISLVEISGDWDERFEKAAKAVHTLLEIR